MVVTLIAYQMLFSHNTIMLLSMDPNLTCRVTRSDIATAKYIGMTDICMVGHVVRSERQASLSANIQFNDKLIIIYRA